MKSLIVTSAELSDEVVEELSTDRTVKTLHHPGAGFDLSPLADLAWPDELIVDESLIDLLPSGIGVPVRPLREVVPDAQLSAPAEIHDRPRGNILFVPCNDTHVRMFLPLARQLENRTFLVIRGENADHYLEEHDERYLRLDLAEFRDERYRASMTKILRKHQTRAIVFANDWTGENRRICELAAELDIPTVCIQEGPQDYELDGGKWRQMLNARHIFSQGAITIRYLEASRFLLTGNPRLTYYTPQPLPAAPRVMINSNFTYNVFEDWRDVWVGDCVNACSALGADYFISQHPRDNGRFTDFKVIPSDAFKIVDQITSSSALITRFSQVLYEAMLSGRQVVYYNPHGEVKRVLTEDRSGAFFHADTPASLEEALRGAIDPQFHNVTERERFLKLHCGPCDGRETERCLAGLAFLERRESTVFSLIRKKYVPGEPLSRSDKERIMRAAVKKYGPYTAQNMKLDEGLYTLDNKVNYDHFKVNRIKQIVSDSGLLRPERSLLDIASLQSMFAIEFAMEGMKVTSLEGRENNIEKGRAAARILGVEERMTFVQDDVNNIRPATHGNFDVILCMGILYHIHRDKYAAFLRNIADCCNDTLIIDSFIALHPNSEVEVDGVRYEGTSWREFDDSASEEEKRKAAHSSLSDNWSFTMTKPDLLRYLRTLGFTTISEIHAPEQPNQPLDRPTLVCRKGTPVSVRVFPEFEFTRHFGEAGDSRGIQGRNVVHWNLPPAEEGGGSFVSHADDLKEQGFNAARGVHTLRFFDEVFDGFETSQGRIVEFGRGESLPLLGRRFPGTQVLAVGRETVEIPPALLARLNLTGRFHRAALAPVDRATLQKILADKFGDGLVDIVIDNGSHLYCDSRLAFDELFVNRLRSGGIYIIEGWGCGYWPKWPDGNPDGLHGLPLFVKELVDQVAMVDRTKLWKGERALPVNDIVPSPIQKLIVNPGAIAMIKA